MSEAYIIDAVRTPRGIGKPGKGALSHLHPQQLASTVLKALKERNKLDTSTVDDIIREVSASRISERGATRADDRFSETSMEDRKREGYF